MLDAASGEEISSCAGTGEPALSLAFAPNGRTLAACGPEGSMITLWHVPTGRALMTLNPRLHEIRSLFFTSDGNQLVVAGQNAAGFGEVLILSGSPAD